MSRCFPYPPPGYVKNGICDEALIESIKLLREGEKAKKKRKERKKEKIWEKKEKEKVRVSEVVESKKHRHKRHKDDRNQEGKKGGGLQKKTENELEKSSLTEEHGHSVGSQDSSDSTLSSTKRQKLSSPPDGENNSGSITWIRLPFQRQNDPKGLPSSEQPCTASGGTDGACTQAMQEHAHRTGLEEGEMPCSPSREITGLEEGKLPCSAAAEMCPELTLRVNEEKPCLSTSVSESSAQMAETVVPSSLCGRCSPQLALKFRDVIENWVPPPMEPDCTFGYKEWLFGTRQDRIHGAKICEAGGLGLPHANSTTLPHVCYLPEVDMYALPFTVPY